MNYFKTGTLLIPLMLMIVACGGDDGGEDAPSVPTASTKPSGPPMPDSPALQAGREVWMANCRNCHQVGLEGAPLFGNADAWAPRLAKGRDTLHDHAINGWFSETRADMPPRGGNPNLTDDEVKAAVDYQLWAALGDAALR